MEFGTGAFLNARGGMSNGISLSAKRRINNLGNFFLASQWIDPLAVARRSEGCLIYDNESSASSPSEITEKLYFAKIFEKTETFLRTFPLGNTNF